MKEKTTTKAYSAAVYHAKRFIRIKQTLDNLKEHYSELCDDYIDVDALMLQCAVENTKKQRHGVCTVSTLESQKGCPGRDVPKVIVDAIDFMEKKDKSLVSWLPYKRGRIPHTWFVCYVNDIVPNIKQRGWKEYHCSHRCNNSSCVTSDHLCWESHKTKLSRRDDLCRAPCPNGDDCEDNCVNSCHCQGIHEPHCL
jgi:hypothetical protein